MQNMEVGKVKIIIRHMITIVWHALQPHSKFIEMDWHFWTVITTLIIDISRNCFRTYSSRALQGQERHHERFLVWVHIKKIDTSQQRSQARADWNNCVSEQDIFLYHSHCRLLEMLECSIHIALLLCADFGIHTHTHTQKFTNTNPSTHLDLAQTYSHTRIHKQIHTHWHTATWIKRLKENAHVFIDTTCMKKYSNAYPCVHFAAGLSASCLW